MAGAPPDRTEERRKAQILALADIFKTTSAGTFVAGAVLPFLSDTGSVSDTLTGSLLAIMFFGVCLFLVREAHK